MISRRHSLLVLPLSAAALLAQKPVPDNEIYDNVRRRLANDAQVKGGALDVDVQKGVVTIRGTLESQKLKDRAGKLAGKVKGVKSVVNEITVRPIRGVR